MDDGIHILIRREGGAPGSGISIQFEYTEFKSQIEALNYYKRVYVTEWLSIRDDEDVNEIVKKIDKSIAKLKGDGEDKKVNLKVLSYNLDHILSDAVMVISSGKLDKFAKETLGYLQKDLTMYLKENEEDIEENELTTLRDELSRIKAIKTLLNKGTLPSKEQLCDLINSMIDRRYSDG
jgi:hypothetical protein